MTAGKNGKRPYRQPDLTPPIVTYTLLYPGLAFTSRIEINAGLNVLSFNRKSKIT